MQEFLLAWELFGDVWLTALLLAALLPWCGVVLVARQQVFVGAAVGQAATFGLAAALALGLGHDAAPGHAHVETTALAFALGAGMVVAIAAMRTLSTGAVALDSRTAVVFLVCGAGAVLLLANAPHGLQEVQRLQLSSLLGASPHDKWIAGAALCASAILLCALRDRVLLWALDPLTAQALGQSTWRWDVLVGVWLGGCLGFAIHVAGLLFAFGVLVLPVLTASALAGSLRGVLWLAPCVGCAGSLLGLALAHTFDLPPGQVVVAVLGAILLLTRLVRRV